MSGLNSTTQTAKRDTDSVDYLVLVGNQKRSDDGSRRGKISIIKAQNVILVGNFEKRESSH